MSRILGRSRSRSWFAALAVGMLVTCASLRSVRAEVFTETKHSVFQAVYDDGKTSWQWQPNISLTGVVINNPWDMLGSSNSAVDPQWQVFIQAADADDFGGTALYMRKNKTQWGISEEYSTLDWYTEMDRVNYPGQSSAPLQRGDLIRVDARAPGMFYAGKYNINEQHLTDAGHNFDITILERGLTLQSASIDLSYLKNSADKFIFDATRATGGERYQGSLVHLDNLTLDSDPSQWVPNGSVTVRQGDLTMPLKLGLDPGLLSIAPSAGTKFGLTAILDQEDGSSPHTDYRLWLSSADDFSVTVPEPGSVALAVIGGLLMYPVVRKRWRRRAPSEE